MRRRLAISFMFLLFGLAHATLERVPRAAVAVLRGGAEHVLPIDRAESGTGPTD